MSSRSRHSRDFPAHGNRGRTLALVGVVLVAVNLRTAVASLSPLYSEIQKDIPLSAVEIGLLGSLPLLCFALFGALVPTLTRWMTLESALVAALVMMAAGLLLRSFAWSFALMGIGSVIVFAGMAVGGVLLPPIVKRYFPERIGLITTVYVTVMAASIFLPPLVAVPAATWIGWRGSIGMWALPVVVASVPWILVLLRSSPAPAAAESVPDIDERRRFSVSGTGIAWALAVIYGVSALNAYALYAWLPQILRDTVGMGPAQTGDMLSLYAATGVPAALLAPSLATRASSTRWIVYSGVGLMTIGYIGLMVIPHEATWLWVTVAGLGAELLFAVVLVLINLRTRTHVGAVALSGFAQSSGYMMAFSGPFVMGALHEASGGWNSSFVFLLGTVGAAAAAAIIVSRPGVLEDHPRAASRE